MAKGQVTNFFIKNGKVFQAQKFLGLRWSKKIASFKKGNQLLMSTNGDKLMMLNISKEKFNFNFIVVLDQQWQEMSFWLTNLLIIKKDEVKVGLGGKDCVTFCNVGTEIVSFQEINLKK